MPTKISFYFRASTRSHDPTDASSLSDSSDDNDDSLYLLRETSTLHGLRDVMLSSSGRLRMVWVLIVILALFMTFQGCYQIMDEYSMRRIVVSYFIQEARKCTDFTIYDILYRFQSQFGYRMLLCVLTIVSTDPLSKQTMFHLN